MDELGDYAHLEHFFEVIQLYNREERAIVSRGFHLVLKRLSKGLPYDENAIEGFLFDSLAFRRANTDVEAYLEAARSAYRSTRVRPLLEKIGPALAKGVYDTGELTRYWREKLDYETLLSKELEEKASAKRKYVDNLKAVFDEQFAKRSASEAEAEAAAPSVVPEIPRK